MIANVLWGDLMKQLIRWSLIASMTAFLAGCANDNNSLLTTLTPVSSAYADSDPSQDPTRKTLASKMLTAIALERVTGRKPDPARLSELH